MTKPMNLAHRTAIVTGAASGIGRALAGALAQRGCHLALADINQLGLQQTAEQIAKPGLRVSCHQLDVADQQAVAHFPTIVREHHPGVDLLFNNAGVGVGGTFEELSDEDFAWLFEINFYGVVRMTRAFLPLLKQSNDARLVNISSVFGMVAPAEETAYVASKFAVRGFSEALRHELEGTSLGVTVVHPGGIATSIADHARVPARMSAEKAARRLTGSRKILTMPPVKAAEIIVRGVEQRKPRVLVGKDAHLLALLVQLAPVSYWKLLKRFLPD